jgi:tellurium resistance protein TerD
MSIHLRKGQHLSLSQEESGLSQLLCGLGWDVASPSTGLLSAFQKKKDFDLDSSVFCLDANGKLEKFSNIIYYANLRHISDSILHLGDNLTGDRTGDDEQILINLPHIPQAIARLSIVINIYNCRDRHQNFSMVENAFVRLVDLAQEREIARYNLSGAEYDGMTGMILAEIYRKNGDWHVTAIGQGIRVSGLEELTQKYFS